MGSSIAGGGGNTDNIDTATSINWGNAWTMLIWVYPTTLSGIQVPVNAGANSRTYPLHFNGTTAKCKDNDDTAFVEITGFTTNKWWCLATSANGSDTTNIYSGDGDTAMTLGDTDSAVSWSSDTSDVIIAGHSTKWPFIGSIAHLHVYTRLLSIPELIEIQYKPGSIANGIACHYPLWDNVNVADLSGLAVDGTVNGTINSSVLGPPVYFPKLGT